MDDLYEGLLSYPLMLAEPKEGAYTPFTERHLQAVWLEQKYFRGLKTSGGLEVEVLSPGIWNSEAGPDFLKAHLRIGGSDLRGDVELHLVQEGWVGHKHHLDPRYNNVVFHLSLWDSKISKEIRTSEKRKVESAFLEKFLTISSDSLLKAIDLDLYPYQKFVGTGYCADRLLSKLPEDKTKSLFLAAACWRLRNKYQFLESWIGKQNCLLLGGIAMALGYKQNSQAFLELYMYLFHLRDLSEEEILALGMGACGFFENRFRKRWGKSLKYQELFELWNFHAPEVDHQAAIVLHQVRPLNHPVRRLVFLSKILSDNYLESIRNRLVMVWKNGFSRCKSKKDFLGLQGQFLQLIPTYTDSYWNHHFLFETDKRSDNLTLIGDGLRKSVLVNTFLPVLYRGAQERADSEELEAFYSFYFSLSSDKNSKTRYLAHRFYGNTALRRTLDRSLMEQGAYQVHKDFCTRYEASCEGCPFVENYEGSTLSYL